MRKASILAARFSELEQQGADIEASKTYEATDFGSGERIDSDRLLNWKVKSKHLIAISCGKESEHYQQFVETEKPEAYRSSYRELKSLMAILSAAREDFSDGYIITFKELIQSELYSDELDQAKGLLAGGYPAAAAVIAGTVLETALRQLCLSSNIPVGKLDRMNADLAKFGSYNLLTQKRITAIADIRNNAAHGNNSEYSTGDVKDMIQYIEKFLSDRT